jgi:aldehyde:ferredoxin oxidoreductase
MHDPRAKLLPGLGIGYAVNPHGADHCFSIGEGTTPMGINQFHPFGILNPLPDDLSARRLSLYRLTHSLGALKDCMVLCMFPQCDYEDQVEILKSVTGWDTGIIELVKVGDRVINLMRMFNIREGFSAANDMLPERYFQPKTDGVLIDKPVDRDQIEKAKRYYYYYMGWDQEGVPLPEKIAELGIE